MITRDIVVAGGLPRHQVKQYLKALGVEWQEVSMPDPLRPAAQPRDESRFSITATDEQWGQIQDWVKKVAG